MQTASVNVWTILASKGLVVDGMACLLWVAAALLPWVRHALWVAIVGT
jgi:hypothetical protein